MIDKIYIISLAHETGRRESISNELTSNGFYNFEFIDAIRGDELGSTDNLVKSGVLSSTFIDPHGSLNKNIIACAQSHKLAYNTFLTTDYETCLILEDDARFSTFYYKLVLNGALNRTINELYNTDWNVFIWGLVGENVPHYAEGLTHLKEYKRFTPDWAAHAYQITRKGAEILIANNTPVQFAADVNIECSDLNIYCTEFTLIHQTTGYVSRFMADNFNHATKGAIEDITYSREFKSSTQSENLNNRTISGHSMYDIYFSPDRSIKYEQIEYRLSIPKNIDFKSVEFKEYIDPRGFSNKNWTHINF